MIYYLIYVILTIFIYRNIESSKKKHEYISIAMIIFAFALLLYVVIDNELTIDMTRYIRSFSRISQIDLLKAIGSTRWETGFVAYQWLLSAISDEAIVFIVTSIFIIFTIKIYAFQKILNYKEISITLLGYLSFFYYYNFYRNIIRQGFAVSFVILGIILLYNKQYFRSVIAFVSAFFFHYSSFISFALIIIRKTAISMKTLIITFLISAIMMLTELNKLLFLIFVNIFGEGFQIGILMDLKEKVLTRYGTSIRVDFLLFTLFWILYSCIIYYVFLKEDELYCWLTKVYIVLSTYFTIFGFIGYSDRIAAYGWSLIPVIAIYPILRIKSIMRVPISIFLLFIFISMFWVFDVFKLYS